MSPGDVDDIPKRVHWWATAAAGLFLAGVSVAVYMGSSANAMEHRVTTLEVKFDDIRSSLDDIKKSQGLILEQHGRSCRSDQ